MKKAATLLALLLVLVLLGGAAAPLLEEPILQIPAPPTLSISTTALPEGTVGTAYTASLAATGGTAPYTWAITGLPGGLSADASGSITGTPTAEGAATVTVTVTDSTPGTPETQSTTLTLTISPAPTPLSITSAALPGGTVGTAYSFQLVAAGGTGPYVWAANGLPAGLSISAGGVISGTPTAAAEATVSIAVTDGASTLVSKDLTLSIIKMPRISTTALPGGLVGNAYSFQLAATGGITPYTWGANSLPAGLSCNSETGLIAGTPTAEGTYSVVVTLSDANSSSHTLTLTLSVKQPPASTTTYRILYDINYDNLGTTIVPDQTGILAGHSVVIPTFAPPRPGYTFTGWSTQPSGGGTNYKPGASITLYANLRLYAQWSKGETASSSVPASSAASSSAPSSSEAPQSSSASSSAAASSAPPASFASSSAAGSSGAPFPWWVAVVAALVGGGILFAVYKKRQGPPPSDDDYDDPEDFSEDTDGIV